MNTTTKKAANSIVGKLTAGILAIAAALFTSFALAQPAAADGVLVVGDSLEVGSAPYLRQAVTSTPLDVDAKNGRTSSEGVRVLADRLGAQHGTIVFPLGTNDTSPAALAASLGAARRLAGGRCIVVATISRPPLRGSSAAPLNRVIDQFAGQGAVQVADWRSAVLSTPGLLGRDQIHPNGRGAALRARLIADAVQGCLLGGDLAGIPAPRNPHARPPPLSQRRDQHAQAPARPAKLPAPEILSAVAGVLARVMHLVAAAVLHAKVAASPAGPEPVLGAP
jgi:lysophospholipase L1-like esterase